MEPPQPGTPRNYAMPFGVLQKGRTMSYDSRYIHVIQLLRITGLHAAKVAFVKDEDNLVDDPLDAKWFDTYDAALKYRTYMEVKNCFSKFTYEPGSVCVMTFGVNATLLGQMPTLKSKPWCPNLVHDELLAQEVKDTSDQHGQDVERVTEDSEGQIVIKGPAIPDITAQSMTTVQYAISFGGGVRRFYAESAYGNTSLKLEDATRYGSFSEALDAATKMKANEINEDIQIHEIIQTTKVGRAVTV